MKKLKPCPYCGSPAEDTAENYCSCSNSDCPSDCVIMNIEQWNHRPTEQAAEQQANAAERLLEGLTPGGSEFYGNPTMCAQWVADRLSTLAKLVLQRKAAEQQAAQAGDLLRTFATAARKLIVYRSKNTLNFQLEKADDFIRELAIAVDNTESFLEGKG